MKHRSLWIRLSLALLACAMLFGAVSLSTPITLAQGPSGTFPDSAFNGMQIIYSVSGGAVTGSKDAFDFTTSRALTGKLGTGQLRVSGKALMGGGYGANLAVTVWAGAEKKDFTAYIKTGWPGFNEQAFDLAVPIPAGAAGGGFSINMVGDYNAGNRSLIVGGAFAGELPTATPAAAARPTATAPKPAATVAAGTVPTLPCKEALNFYTSDDLNGYYTGQQSLNYTRDQLVAELMGGLDDYVRDGGKPVDGVRSFDAPMTAATLATGAMPTGNEDTLRQMVRDRAANGQKLTPKELFYLSLKATNGNVRSALLTCHAVLYRGQKQNGQFIADNLVPLRNPAGYSDKTQIPVGNKKTNTPRLAVGNDQQGVWYHLFGMTALELTDQNGLAPFVVSRLGKNLVQGEYWNALLGESYPRSDIGGKLSDYAVKVENDIRVSNQAPADPDKQCINYTGIAAGSALAARLNVLKFKSSVPVAPGSLRPTTAFMLRSPVSLVIKGVNGEQFAFNQASKQFSGTTADVIFDLAEEPDGTWALAAIPLFPVKQAVLTGSAAGEVTFATYSFEQAEALTYQFPVKAGQEAVLDIGPGQPALKLGSQSIAPTVYSNRANLLLSQYGWLAIPAACLIVGFGLLGVVAILLARRGARAAVPAATPVARFTARGRACAACGAAVGPGYAFCPSCGRPAGVAPSAAFCEHCGAGLAPGAKFCARCGQNTAS
jgi:hypothetical protein